MFDEALVVVVVELVVVVVVETVIIIAFRACPVFALMAIGLDSGAFTVRLASLLRGMLKLVTSFTFCCPP